MKKEIIGFMLVLSMVTACVPTVNAVAAEMPKHQVEEETAENGRLSVKADSADAIGYSFRASYMPTDIYGFISCNAYKNEKDIVYCSVFGEYDTIKFSFNPSNFSVSYPAGLSFGFGTSRDRYTIQEALYIGETLV